ncbi:MAG: pseudouridine synthase [Oceanobacter sp.]
MSRSLESPTTHSEFKTESGVGFWLDGQVFRTQALPELWQYWHKSRPDPGLVVALSCGWIRITEAGESVDTLNSDFLLLPGMRYQLWLEGHAEAEVDSRWKLLWHDNDLQAVYKPPLLPVSRTTRNLFQTLIGLVRRHTQFEDAHLLHRIDAETSGIVLIAANSHADKKWKKRMDRLVSLKGYVALVGGEVEWSELNDSCWLAERLDGAIKSQMHVAENPEAAGWIKPKHAETWFKRLKVFREEGQVRTLVACQLGTGRRHQLRARLSSLGHPIVGDKIYSHDGYFYLKRLEQDGLSASDYQALGAPHQLLHAVHLNVTRFGHTQSIHSYQQMPDSWPSDVRDWLLENASSIEWKSVED